MTTSPISNSKALFRLAFERSVNDLRAFDRQAVDLQIQVEFRTTAASV